MGSVTVTPGASQPLQTEQPQNTATIPQQQPQPAPVATQAPAVHPAVAKDALFGRAAKMLMGSSTSYQVDPQSGQTVTTQTPNKPGAFFKNILNAAILGGAAAEEAHNKNPYMGFGGGAVSGGAGAIQDARQQDILKRQQAQEQFNNQQKAAQEQREQQGFDTEQQVRKANIAMLNIQTLRLNKELQGADLDQHIKIAEADKELVKPFADAGVVPVAQNIPESETTQYFKDHPGSSTLVWAHTGVKMGSDANGQPTYESTMTAYDPKAPVTLTKDALGQMEKDGVMKRFPEYSALKPGQQISTTQYVSLLQTDKTVRADTQALQRADTDSQEARARINADNARAAASYAEAGVHKEELKNMNLSEVEGQNLKDAMQDVKNHNGDMGAVSTATRITLAESMSKMVPGLTAAYKAALANPEDPDSQASAKDLMTKIETLTNFGTQALKSLTPTPVDYVGADGTKYALPPDKVPAFLKAHPDAKLAGAAPSSVAASNNSGVGPTPEQAKQSQAETRGVLKGVVKNSIMNPSLLP